MPQNHRRSVVGLVMLIALATTASAAVIVPIPGVSIDRILVTQEPMRPGDGVQLPRVIREVRPEYTQAAKDAKIQGSILLSIVVESDGSVGDVSVIRSLDVTHGLDQAAVDAAKHWEFEPGRKEGRAVPVQVEIEMRFTLRP